MIYLTETYNFRDSTPLVISLPVDDIPLPGAAIAPDGELVIVRDPVPESERYVNMRFAARYLGLSPIIDPELDRHSAVTHVFMNN